MLRAKSETRPPEAETRLYHFVFTRPLDRFILPVLAFMPNVKYGFFAVYIYICRQKWLPWKKYKQSHSWKPR